MVFVSGASNLVRKDKNGAEDIFVRDRVAGSTERVSVTSDGEEANSSSTETSISANGRWVVFSSFATNLVSDDTNERHDVFVRDRAAGTTIRVSVNSDEEQSNGNSQDPGVRGFTASGPDITPDGRFVAFFSSATNLVSGDTNTCPPVFDQEPGRCPDVFVRDLVEGTTMRINATDDQAEANERSSDPAISDDGRAVAFFSAAGNLVPTDSNVCPPRFFAFPGNCPDIFVKVMDAP